MVLGMTNEERLEKKSKVKRALALANKFEEIHALYQPKDRIVYDVDSVDTMCDDALKYWDYFCKIHSDILEI